MSQEIERKFLVKDSSFKHVTESEFRIKQGYLSSDPRRSVRIRVKGKTGYITVKGPSNPTGTSRFEWEKEISVLEAESLLKICEPGVINKKRHNIKCGYHTFEVDEFYGENEGLIIAEVELTSENESFEKPSWLGKEVTGDTKYYNSSLVKKPFKNWE